MMYKIIILILFATFVSCSQSFNTNEDEKSKSTNEVLVFDTLINRIAVRIIDLTAPGELSRIDDFEVIYENPTIYLEDAKRYLSSNENSDLKKRICIYSLQKLSFNQYLNFTKYCLKAFTDGKLDERILYLAVFPAPWITDTRFADAYKQDDVKKLFSEMLLNEKISNDNKSGIQYAKSGDMIKSRNQLKD